MPYPLPYYDTPTPNPEHSAAMEDWLFKHREKGHKLQKLASLTDTGESVMGMRKLIGSAKWKCDCGDFFYCQSQYIIEGFRRD